MRIVIVDTTLQGPLIGGAQTFLPLLIKGLKESFHKVHLVISGEPDKKIATAIVNSGAIVHTDIWDKKLLVEDAASLFATWINNLQPDIYLVSVSPDIGWVALPYLNPTIATLTIGHTDSETFYAPARHYKSFLTKAIAVSDQVSEEYIASCQLLPAQVQWIPYGVKVNSCPPVAIVDDVLKMIYVGRIDEHQKQVSVLAAVVKKMTQEAASFQLTIVGDGPEMPTLRDTLSEEITSGKVKLMGWLSSAEVAASFKKSDVFVLTSAYEGFCIALVEAMANGCCPVVTDIRSGNKQLIENGENGFLIEVGNVNGFVQTLKSLQQNRSLLLAMRNAAWQKGKQYSISRMVNEYIGAFEEAKDMAKANPRNANPQFPVMQSCRSIYPYWIRRIKIFLKNLIAA